MIDYELRGDIAWLRIDRESQKNALSPETHRALTGALERAEGAARVAVVTAVGDDVFCAGSDLGALQETYETGDVEGFIEAEFELFRNIETLDIPVIAAVNGDAYGGGLELVAVCDVAVAVRDAEFALPETRLGLTPGYALDRANAVLGRKRTMELALTSEPIDAATAQDWGLVNRVVERGALESAVVELANGIVAAPRYAVGVVKETINEPIEEDVSYRRSVDRLDSLLSQPEAQTRLDAFFREKTTDADSQPE